MHFHVFTIDLLPGNKTVSTGGGLRSKQIIEGLRKAGADVTYSMPKASDSVKRFWSVLDSSERELAFDFSEAGRSPLDIVNRLAPDAAVFLWPKLFTFPRAQKRNVINIYDINGLQNIEGALFEAALNKSVPNIKNATVEYLNTLKCADIVLTGSSQQAAFWSGLFAFNENSSQGLDAIEIPFVPPIRSAEFTYDAGSPTFYISGSFLPWNSPGRWIANIAEVLENKKKGKLVVVGKANALLPHGEILNAELRKFAESNFVEVKDSMHLDDFTTMIRGNGVAIDLHEKTLERQLALPIRTLVYLANGVPVVSDNYSNISSLIEKHDAGWRFDPSDVAAIQDFVARILDNPLGSGLSQKSMNGPKLLKNCFDSTAGFERLIKKVEILHTKSLTTTRTAREKSYFNSRKRSSPVVLVLTDDHENFISLRIKIPFDAMYRAGHIGGYIVLANGKIHSLTGDRDRLATIDAIWVQRGALSYVSFLTEFFPEQYNLDLDDNLFITPSYRTPYGQPWIAGLSSLVKSAGTISTTTSRLVESLKRTLGFQIEHKIVLAPNLTDQLFRRRFKTKPEALLLASSDKLPLTTSRAPFFTAINSFAKSRGLPVFYIGTGANNFPELDCDIYETGFLSYSDYRRFLHNENVLAVAPLDTHADALTQEFINCKSDIKMVEFASFGVPALYSEAAPYSDSPLNAGPLVDCSDAKAIIDCLDEIYYDPDLGLRCAYESIMEHRFADDVVGQSWACAIDKVRFAVGIPFEALMEKFAISRTTVQGGYSVVPESDFNASDYQTLNPDVPAILVDRGITAYQHYTLYGAKEGRLWFPATSKTERVSASDIRNQLLSDLDLMTAFELRARGILDN
ncbi:glycosyltransferase family protein [Methylobacterium sp. CM6246]